jgi:Peptidase family M28
MKWRWVFVALLSCLMILGCTAAQLKPPTPTPSLTVTSSTPASTPTPIAPLNVSAAQLQKHLENLEFERHTLAGRQRARNYIRQTLESYGWSVQEHIFEQGVNLWAERPGKSPNPQKILLGAHYDTVSGTVGASDNATGVVVLLEMARLLAQAPIGQTLQIVFFDQEEQGILGSAAWASHEPFQKNLAGAVILDMVGFTCQTPGCQQKPEGLNVELPSDRGDFLAALGDAEHPELLNAVEKSALPDRPKILTLSIPFKGLLVPVAVRSDHVPFWLQGMGAVLITDTAFLRNPHYHQPTDTLSTLDLPFLADNAQIVANTLRNLLQ